MKETVELLSPAGSFESLRAAIQGGCDSVYFGIEQLNMRARSANLFTLDEIPQITEIIRENNKKCYLTLNTILYDHDLSVMRDIVDRAQESGVNAIIASDHAVMNYCRKKNMPVHISTQANISNVEAVEFYAVYADVMVLARELSLMQVKDMAREIRRRDIRGPGGEFVRLEIFAHGALCMAVSGKCYLSLHSHYASANRGACVQNCRRSYIVTDKEEGIEFEIENENIMSAKDLCTIDFLDKIIDSGTRVIKIEGRGRASEYVYTTTKCYREALDSIHAGTYSKEKIESWKDQLSTVYNRGFWDGYYLGRKMGEWSDAYGSKATKKKIYLAKGVKYYDQLQVAEFQCEAHKISVGDEIIISGPTTGYIQMEVDVIHVNRTSVPTAEQGQNFTIPMAQKIRPSDKLYKLVNS